MFLARLNKNPFYGRGGGFLTGVVTINLRDCVIEIASFNNQTCDGNLKTSNSTSQKQY